MAKGGKKNRAEEKDPGSELPEEMDELAEAAEAAAKIQARKRGNDVRKAQKFEVIQLILKANPNEDLKELEAKSLKELKELAKVDGVSGSALKKAKKTAEDLVPDEAATMVQSAWRKKAAQKEAKVRKKLKAKQDERRKKIQEEAEIRIANDVSGLFKPGEGAYVRSGNDRGCTDCLCCIIFAAYWFGMCFLIWFATEYGELDRLIRPRDMNGNSCGMMNGEGADAADLTDFPQLYLPNPSDETKQICVNGCPGSSKGTCNGALLKTTDGVVGLDNGGAPLPYHTDAAWIEAGVPKALVNWQRQQEGKAIFGTRDDVVDGAVPWYTSEPECLEKGDCNEIAGSSTINVEKDVVSTTCLVSGRCMNQTRFDLDGVIENTLTPGGSDVWRSSEELACEGTSLAPTGNRFIPFEWKAYSWAYDETDDNLFICMPKEGCTLPGCEKESYPPETFVEANTNRFLSQDGPCWLPVLPSDEYLFRCVPSLLLETAQSQADAQASSADGQVTVQYMQDLQDYWRMIPFGGFVAVLAAFAWIIFLGKFAYYLIVGTCIATPIVSLAISATCFYKLGAIPTRSCVATSPTATVAVLEACMGADISHSPEDMEYLGYAEENCMTAYEPEGTCSYTTGLYIEIPPEVQAAMDEANTTDEYTEYIAWGTLIGAFVLALIFIIFWERVMISIGVIEEASDAFLDVPFAIFLPLFVLAASLPVSAFCCFACFLLLSLRRVTEDGAVLLCMRNDDMSIPLADIEQEYNPDDSCVFPTVLQGLIFAQVFGWLWTVQWFLSGQYTTIAGAISKWYFTPENPKTHEKKISAVLLSHSAIRTVRHHSGTMAFGSFIIAVVICVKFALVYAINQVQAQSPENKVIKVLGNVLKVVVSCVERFVRFVGHLAYIETAIYGNNFCHALFKAVKALARNVVRFSFVALFSKLVLTLGKILVVVSAVGLSNILIENFKTPSPDADTCAAIGIAGLTEGENCNLNGKCVWNADDRTCDAGSTDLPNQSLPIFPLLLTVFFAATISLNIMGIYETAIDTIMVSFLEDEQENDKNGEVTFAAGPLKDFMKSTKSIADATEKYAEDIRNAKSGKIRANNEVSAKMKESDLTPGGGNKDLKKKRKEDRNKKKKHNKDTKAGETKEEKKARKKKEKAEFNSASKGIKGEE